MTNDLLLAGQIPTLFIDGDLADFWWQIATAFVMGAVPTLEVLLAIPAAVVLGLPPVLAGLTATVGNLISLVILILAEARARSWFVKRFANHSAGKVSPRRQRFQRIWDRYGVPGVALLAPLTIGSHMTLILALLLSESRTRVIVWMLGSVIFWGGVITLLLALGFETFYRFF